MGFELIGPKGSGKYLFRFEPLGGWSPTADAIFGGKGLYDCNNVRLMGGKVSTRGGWAPHSAETGVIRGMHGYKGSTLFSVLDNVGQASLRYYDGGWIDLSAGVAAAVDRGNLDGNAEFTFTEAARAGLNSYLVAVGGTGNNPLRYAVDEAVPIELTGTFVFKGVDGEDDNWTTGTKDTTNTRVGDYGLALTGTSDTDTYSVGSGYTDTHDATSDYSNQWVDGNWSHLQSDGDDTGFIYEAPVSAPDNTRGLLRNVDGIKRSDDGVTPASPTSINTTGSAVTSRFVWVTNPFTGNAWEVDDLKDITQFGIFEDDNNENWLGNVVVDPILSTHTITSVDVVVRIKAPGDGWIYCYKCYLEVNYYSNSLDVDGYETDSTDGIGDGDELVMHMYVDDASNLTEASCTVILTESGSETITFGFDDFSNNRPLVDGWNTMWVALRDTNRAASASWDDNLDWDQITTVAITIVASSAVVMSVDCMYFRKSSVLNEDDGSKQRPPRAKYCTMSPHGDRLILANTETVSSPAITSGDKSGASKYNSGPTFLWYSDAYNIDSFASTNFVAFTEDITGVISDAEFTYVFTANKRYLMRPNYGSSDLVSTALDWQVGIGGGPGCVSHKTISRGEYNGKSGVFYLAKDGLYFCMGPEYVKVTTELDILFKARLAGDDWEGESLDQEKLSSAAGIYSNGYYTFSYFGSEDDTPDLMLVIDTATGEIVKDVPSSTVNASHFATSDLGGANHTWIGDAVGDVYYYDYTRTVVLDNDVAHVSDFQTKYIGLELFSNIKWECLNLWVRCDAASAMSIKVLVYRLEDYDDNSDYTEWQEELTTAFLTVTTAFTPNAAFKWHRLRIPLLDASTPLYPTSRGISLKVYDDNDTACDYFLESLVLTQLNQELL